LGEAALAFVNGSPPLTTAKNGDATAETLLENSSKVRELPTVTTTASSPGTVSMTFRLPAELSARLLRVSLDRKLKRLEPFSQQDIVAVALADWLKKQDDSI
jgi:hypothetical protein